MRTRREFLRLAGLYAAGFAGLQLLANRPLAAAMDALAEGYGPLEKDSGGLLRLPAGFRATAFSRTGETMADGLRVPGRHDGMAAFPGPGGRTILVRNHELESAWTELGAFGRRGELLARVPADRLYDRGHGIAPNLGGTTTLVFNPRTQRLETHFLSLAGTVRNCAGGPTPWGTWITCEEVNDDREPHAEREHGYNFEVRPGTRPGLQKPVPLTAMGRFRHEAVAVDPRTGIVYQTEDVGDGLLYRFVPRQPGRLAAGGRLQALALRDGMAADTRNWKGRSFPLRTPLPVRWIDLEETDNPRNDLRHRGAANGAAVFARGEGAWWGNDAAYFAMTTGGRRQRGQVFRYVPGRAEGTPREERDPGRLELFAEPNDRALMSHCDNLTVAPWGDLVLCEDTDRACRVIGVTPAGSTYVIAENSHRGRELAGACFSPDGSTLFVNVQTPGFTVAITGPWKRRVA